MAKKAAPRKRQTGPRVCGPAKLADRLEAVRDLLGSGKRDGEIKLTLSKKWGMRRRSIEGYITIARQQIRREIVQDKRTLQGNAIEFYRSIASNAKLPPLSRLRAQENIDKILGLHTPMKTFAEMESAVAAPAAPAAASNARQELLKDPRFVEWARQQAVKEDAANEGRGREDSSDADSSTVCEDSDEG